MTALATVAPPGHARALEAVQRAIRDDHQWTVKEAATAALAKLVQTQDREEVCTRPSCLPPEPQRHPSIKHEKLS
jgi:hypothetical protein